MQKFSLLCFKIKYSQIILTPTNNSTLSDYFVNEAKGNNPIKFSQDFSYFSPRPYVVEANTADHSKSGEDHSGADLSLRILWT